MKGLRAAVILDESSSMGPLISDTRAGYNKFVTDQKNIGDDMELTLVKFNSEAKTIFSGRKIQDVKELTEEDYSPNGWTALLDAVDRSISELESLEKNDPSDKVVVVIITDGEENSSRRATKEEVKKKIEFLTNEKHWDFVYLGANVDKFTTERIGTDLGLSASNTAFYNSTVVGTAELYGSVSDKFGKARSSLKSSNFLKSSNTMAYTAEEKEELENKK